MPSEIDPNAPRSWLAISSADLRSLCGLNVTNIAAVLGAEEKLAPSSPTKNALLSTPSVASARRLTSCMTRSVRSSDAPGGSCAATMT